MATAVYLTEKATYRFGGVTVLTAIIPATVFMTTLLKLFLFLEGTVTSSM